MVSKSLNSYFSRVVSIGDLPLGGDYPVRIQSMTNTNTLDTQATVEQCQRMIYAGCEYVRITAQGVREANNLGLIKKKLKLSGYTTPLIADIHFNPKAAEVAAALVEKVRINPGNYVDKKKGKSAFSVTEYDYSLEKARERIAPLIQICKDYGTAIRIGSNHGSLSERILFKYGNTAEGMVASAIEFIKILESHSFYNTVISMKASNVKVMLEANHLLVKKMLKEGMNYPLHLGVTEAGNAEDGRIKSAAGIGPLLAAGIGNTIRVSLTEEPEFEIPVARNIVNSTLNQRIDFSKERSNIQLSDFSNIVESNRIKGPVVITNLAENNSGKKQADFIYNGKCLKNSKNNQLLEVFHVNKRESLSSEISQKVFFIDIETLEEIDLFRIEGKAIILDAGENISAKKILDCINNIKDTNRLASVVVKRDYGNLTMEDMMVKSSWEFSLFFKNTGISGIWLESSVVSNENLVKQSFDILQAIGKRSSKTEYISCPSCGRTLFNIQDTLNVIKQRTSHIPGLKIGVMGCIVNGPGEMADAHYGYVGGGPGKVNLYKGQEIVLKNIDEDKAVEQLIHLIKENGDWKELS